MTSEGWSYSFLASIPRHPASFCLDLLVPLTAAENNPTENLINILVAFQFRIVFVQVRLCLGYYAHAGFAGWSRKEHDVEPQSVEITDTGKWRLRHGNKLDVVCQSLFPTPIRFREVWKQVRS